MYIKSQKFDKINNIKDLNNNHIYTSWLSTQMDQYEADWEPDAHSNMNRHCDDSEEEIITTNKR